MPVSVAIVIKYTLHQCLLEWLSNPFSHTFNQNESSDFLIPKGLPSYLKRGDADDTELQIMYSLS